MRLAVTGFVSDHAGSIAGANALLLKELLHLGHQIDFFSKASFVDPRNVVGKRQGFRFFDVDNRFFDRWRQRTARIPFLNMLTQRLDVHSYNRLLVQSIQMHHDELAYDIVFWMGDYASGTVRGCPTVSFGQGPPGTDARSIQSRFAEIKRLAGTAKAWKWRTLASLRLSSLGLPKFKCSDSIIVGSSRSKQTLERIYGISESKIATLPYPIDLKLFQPLSSPKSTSSSVHAGCKQLRLLWLGRIVPRKRLDLFLSASSMAIKNGVDLELTIVGNTGFIPEYKVLIDNFDFPERLNWIRSLPRDEVPDLLHRHDVLVQPSDEEDFGSSVAEAQACGLPVIVGSTNGNADYLCSRDIHLADDQSRTLADAIKSFWKLKTEGKLSEHGDSRALAQRLFDLQVVSKRLESVLRDTVERFQEKSSTSVRRDRNSNR